MFDKVPPHNLEAEQSLLGAMLIDKDVVYEVINNISVGDFYSESHQNIYDAITTLFSEFKPIDAISVADMLERNGRLDKSEGKAYIHTLVSSVCSTAGAGYYAKIVKDASLYRQFIKAGMDLISVAFKQPENVQEFLSEAEGLIAGISGNNTKDNVYSLKDLARQEFENLEALTESGKPADGIMSGFSELDWHVGGFKPGELILLAARPAVGKSAIALNIATNIGLRGIPVLFFSLEMSKKQLVQRVMSSISGVNSFNIRRGIIEKADWNKLYQAISNIYQTKILIDDSSYHNTTTIKANARRAFRRSEKPGLIIIDYLQLIKERRGRDRREEVDVISRNLKLISKELNVPVLALSQLNRGVEYRADKRPALSDLRESGSLEQDADIVLMMYRDTTSEDQPTGLIIAKNRSGRTGEIELTFDARYTRFKGRR